ncbi:hypothetical protein PISMIDRAFT_40192, partial [Pisolithus microcarpus 441]
VGAVAFVDESQVVAGYGNGDIRRWNIEDGQQLGPTMQGGAHCVYSVAVSQDGRWIVSGQLGNKAIVWNAFTNEKVRHTECGSTVYAVDILSDGSKVVAVGFVGTDNVRLFDIASGTQLLPPISHSRVADVKFSPDGTSNGKFIACSAGSSVSLWDCMSHRQIGPIITHTSEIRCIALSPSGGYLACG